MLRPPGDLVAELRAAANLSGDELARATDLPISSLKAFEEQGQGLSIAQVERIAKFFKVDPLALLSGDLDPGESLKLFFNKRGARDFFPDDKPLLSQALHRARILWDLNELLGETPNLRAKFVPQAVGDVPYADGYRLAREVRRVLGNPDQLLPGLSAVLENQFSILVAEGKFGSPTIQAVSVKQGSGAAAILLNQSNPGFGSPLSRRVNLAHELGHILFDEERDGFGLVVDRGTKSGRNLLVEDSSPTEQRAKAFAAEFLMPLAGLQRILGPSARANKERTAFAKIDEVRRAFHTTYEISLYQLVNQGYIARSLKEKLQRRWPESMEPPAEAEPDVPLSGRVRQALDRGVITSMRARELLGLSIWDPLPWDRSGADADAVPA
jgi:Zn-dependent peptidase ImmA (M78 family)/transcriptional regulator with XRE-family HTH domain